MGCCLLYPQELMVYLILASLNVLLILQCSRHLLYNANNVDFFFWERAFPFQILLVCVNGFWHYLEFSYFLFFFFIANETNTHVIALWCLDYFFFALVIPQGYLISSYHAKISWSEFRKYLELIQWIFLQMMTDKSH